MSIRAGLFFSFFFSFVLFFSVGNSIIIGMPNLEVPRFTLVFWHFTLVFWRFTLVCGSLPWFLGLGLDFFY